MKDYHKEIKDLVRFIVGFTLFRDKKDCERLEAILTYRLTDLVYSAKISALTEVNEKRQKFIEKIQGNYSDFITKEQLEKQEEGSYIL
jgi:hypothetical protein